MNLVIPAGSSFRLLGNEWYYEVKPLLVGRKTKREVFRQFIFDIRRLFKQKLSVCEYASEMVRLFNRDTTIRIPLDTCDIKQRIVIASVPIAHFKAMRDYYFDLSSAAQIKEDYDAWMDYKLQWQREEVKAKNWETYVRNFIPPDTPEYVIFNEGK